MIPGPPGCRGPMLLLLSTALAGDPCPIPVRFMEVTPSWRERTADLAALKRQRTMYGVTYRGQPVRVSGTPAATHC